MREVLIELHRLLAVFCQQCHASIIYPDACDADGPAMHFQAYIAPIAPLIEHEAPAAAAVIRAIDAKSLPSALAMATALQAALVPLVAIPAPNGSNLHVFHDSSPAQSLAIAAVWLARLSVFRPPIPPSDPVAREMTAFATLGLAPHADNLPNSFAASIKMDAGALRSGLLSDISNLTNTLAPIGMQQASLSFPPTVPI